MSTFIEFNSTDDLPIRAIQKLNHNFKNINGSETSATIVRMIEDTVTYESLSDKPTINGILIIGDVSLEDLGVCPVDNDGMVPIDRLPGYVDDVIECRIDQSAQPHSANWLINLETDETVTPETGKVYLVINSDSTAVYRWSGSVYAQVSAVIDDYRQLSNRPSIENIELVEDRSFPDLGIFIDPEEQYPQSDKYALDNLEIDALWNLATV